MSHTPYKALLKAIRNDDYRHWQLHVRKWEEKQKEPMTIPVREEVGKVVYNAVLHHAVANLQFEPEELETLQAIQDYFGLANDVVNEIKRPYAPKALKMLADWFLTDGILTGSERAQLRDFGGQLGLSKAELNDFISELEGKMAA